MHQSILGLYTATLQCMTVTMAFFLPQVGLQVYFEMNDEDISTSSEFEYELIDSFAIDLTFPVGTVTNRRTYNGSFGLAMIDLSFDLICQANYYGPDCSRFCISDCSCDPGFTGQYCQVDINECETLAVNCSANGKCVDGNNSYSCNCDPGYTGQICESDIDECLELSVECGSNGVCEDMVDNYSCNCDTGYTGQFCENDIDECLELRVECGSNMHCEDMVNNYSCVCDSGYTGELCDQNGK